MPSLSRFTLIYYSYISAFLHHAILPASLYLAKPPQFASSNAAPNAIKAQTLPQFWRRLPILQGGITRPSYHSHIIALQPQ